MSIIFATISILAITAIVYLAQDFLPFKVCAICAGVAGTWILMFIGMLSGQLLTSDFQLPISILMGGSVVGIAYQLERRRAFVGVFSGKLVFWKAIFIPIGFLAVYELVNQKWLEFGGAAFLLILFTVLLFKSEITKGKSAPSDVVKELEKKMEQCC
ncbi:MAG TPA: hypothetical protein VJB92_03010 [Candidatus Paceibacterota bacterium]